METHLPANMPRCTVADLVRLLRAIPRPDESYLDTVEALVKRQPPLPGTPWRR